MTTTECMSTVSNGDIISGELVIKFTNVSNDNFLKYRARIREIIGFGNIKLSKSTMLETDIEVETTALVNNRKEDMGIPPAAQALPTTPGIAETAKPPKPPKVIVPKQKRPYLGQESRELLQTCIGLTNTEVVKKYRQRFKTTKYFDAEIIQMFNRVHGIQ